MLKSTIKVKNGIDIGQYHRLTAYLKRNATVYEAKKSEILTKQQICDFLVKAPDEIYLAIKVRSN